jgi:fructosamine-3-kinase
MKDEPKKSREEIEAIKFAHKRLSWIENVCRVKGIEFQEAEALWTKIYNSKKP